ncbi:ATP-binding protein [Vibrio crassostreae]|uniref:ATP-binding protein n=1 Tax=Vibrio crassostreae TaxID=246167 RepID=UPI001B313CAE|nr:transporter substrate-binding domain-containing protein [Vibrio crassostreae]
MSERFILSLKKLLVSFIIGLLAWPLIIGGANAAEVPDAELDLWLEKQPTITFIALSNHYPYSFLDDNGQVSGIIKDWTLDLEERFGVNARFISVNSRVEAKAALLDGRGDVFPFQQFDLSGDKRVLVSEPYVPYQVAIIVPADSTIDTNLDQTPKRRIAMVNEDIDLERAGVQLTSIERVDFDSVIDAVRALGEGDVEGVVGEPITIMDLANKIGVDDLTVNYLLDHWKWFEASIVVRAGEKELLALVNKQIETIDVNDKNRILSKWLDTSPYRVPLKGVFGFSNPPYMYPDSTAVGLEHEIIQRALNDMGYKLDDVVTLPPSAARKAIDSNNAIAFVSGVQFGDPDTHFLSDNVLDIEFIPVSLTRRKLNLQSQSNLSLGALLFDETSRIKNSIEVLKGKVDIERVEDYEGLESAFSQLRAQNVDLLMVERRELEWFITNTRFIEMAELTLHDEYKIAYSNYVDFRSEEIRDSFNAAIKKLKQADDGLSEIIELQVQNDFSQILKKANVIAQISAYFIVNDRFEELPRLFETFDTASSFQVITAQADSDSRPIKSWNIGNLVDDYGEKKNISHFSSVTKVANYRTKGGSTNSGSMTFYFDTKSIERNYVYFPSVEQLSSFGDAAQRYIADIYQESNLTGELLNLSQEEREWIKNNPDVRIGIDPNSLPYEAVSNTGEYIGMIDDYLTLIEQKTGLSILHVDVADWSETRRLVDHHEVELVSAAKENLSLGDNVKAAKNLFSSRLALASRRDVSSLVLEEATGWKIGILKNAANTELIVDQYPNVEWVLVDATSDGLRMLDESTLDGMIDTVDVLNYLIDSYGHRDIGIIGRLDFFLSPTLHVIKSEPLLFSIVNKAIDSISAEEHQKISAKWAAPKAIERVDYQLVYTISVFSLVILLLIIFWNRKLAKQISIANEATEALKKAQNQLYNMLNSSPIAAAVVFEEKARYANDTAKRLFDFENQPLSSIDVVDIHDSLAVRDEVHQELALNGKVENRELVLKRSDGTRFVALVSYYLFELDGELATLFWAFDISEMKRLNEQLEEEKERADLASQAKSEFLANMSHEIRTPMNAIIGLSYLAMGEIVNPVARTYVEKVHRSGHSLLSIINDILDFSKIEAGQLFIDNIPFNSLTTFHDVIELMDSKAAEKQLSLSMSIDPELDTPLRGDPLRLFQVVLNLIGNAIKFTAKGSVVLTVAHVKSNEDSLTMKVSVRDTGIGISDENLHKLFEAFSQADTTTTRRFGGTGLGLNISQKLVHAMGSKITVESVLGQGSEFSFELTLPRSTHEELTQFKSQELHLDYQIEFKGQRVLLVEDNELNQDLALAFFTRSKLNADLAKNGKEAVELAQINDYEMIFMDLQMPVMDGFEATRQIREFDTKVPIIAVSANVFADAKQKARDAGVTDFLDKPIIIDKATSLIVKYIVPEVIVEGKAAPFDRQTEPLERLTSKPKSNDAISVFSQQRFEQLTLHDSELQNKLIGKFHSTAPSMMVDAFDNLVQNDWITLERNLHTLKSMAASIGGLQLADLMGELEGKAHNSLCDEQDLREGEERLAELIAATDSQIVKPQAECVNEVSVMESVLTEDHKVKLLSLLEAYDNDATQYVAELLVQYPYAAVLKDIQSALVSYDFERASEVLRSLE